MWFNLYEVAQLWQQSKICFWLLSPSGVCWWRGCKSSGGLPVGHMFNGAVQLCSYQQLVNFYHCSAIKMHHHELAWDPPREQGKLDGPLSRWGQLGSYFYFEIIENTSVSAKQKQTNVATWCQQLTTPYNCSLLLLCNRWWWQPGSAILPDNLQSTSGNHQAFKFHHRCETGWTFEAFVQQFSFSNKMIWVLSNSEILHNKTAKAKNWWHATHISVPKSVFWRQKMWVDFRCTYGWLGLKCMSLLLLCVEWPCCRKGQSFAMKASIWIRTAWGSLETRGLPAWCLRHPLAT